MRRQVLAKGAVTLAVAAAARIVLAAPPAAAHGEHAQQPFLRTRTVSWLDVRFDPDHLRVGDQTTIRGRFYLTRSWPTGLKPPTDSQLTVAAPGPALLVTDRRLGGVFVPQTISLELGHVYDFVITLKARRAGRFHVHPMVSVKGAGPIIGPGQWVEVEPGPRRVFRNPLRLMSGHVVDLERFPLATALPWYLLFFALGAVWLGYWLATKPLIHRMALLQTHRITAPALLTRTDLRVSAMVGTLAVASAMAGVGYAVARWPNVIPLQVRHSDPPPTSVRTLDIQPVGLARMNPLADRVVATLDVTNPAGVPLSLNDVVVGPLTFRKNSSVALLEAEPTTLTPSGTTRLRLRLTSPSWTADHLMPRAEVETTLGLVLIFTDPQDAPWLAEGIAAAVEDRSA